MPPTEGGVLEGSRMGSVSSILNDPKAGARKLAEAVSRDPTLRSLVLRMANSA